VAGNSVGCTRREGGDRYLYLKKGTRDRGKVWAKKKIGLPTGGSVLPRDAGGLQKIKSPTMRGKNAAKEGEAAKSGGLGRG